MCGDLWGPREMKGRPEHWGLGVGETCVKEGAPGVEGGLPRTIPPSLLWSRACLGPRTQRCRWGVAVTRDSHYHPHSDQQPLGFMQPRPAQCGPGASCAVLLPCGEARRETALEGARTVDPAHPGYGPLEAAVKRV